MLDMQTSSKLDDPKNVPQFRNLFRQQLFLYYDGNIPTSSKKHWEEYSKKLERLSKLQTFHHL